MEDQECGPDGCWNPKGKNNLKKTGLKIKKAVGRVVQNVENFVKEHGGKDIHTGGGGRVKEGSHVNPRSMGAGASSKSGYAHNSYDVNK